MNAIDRQTTHAGQSKVTITSMHANAEQFRGVLTYLTSFFRSIRETAEPLHWSARWRSILSRVFVWFLGGTPLKEQPLLPQPAH